MSSLCPNHDDLAAYALGSLPRERYEEIDTHLDECAACQTQLETCGNGNDTFLAKLRVPEPSEEFLIDAECADLLDRVAGLVTLIDEDIRAIEDDVAAIRTLEREGIFEMEQEPAE